MERRTVCNKSRDNGNKKNQIQFLFKLMDFYVCMLIEPGLEHLAYHSTIAAAEIMLELLMHRVKVNNSGRLIYNIKTRKEYLLCCKVLKISVNKLSASTICTEKLSYESESEEIIKLNISYTVIIFRDWSTSNVTPFIIINSN